MKLATFSPSTDISHFLLFCCIIFFSPNVTNPFVSGAKPPPTCSGSSQRYEGMLVVHRYGPCSPFGHEKSLADSAQILRQDEQRIQSLNTLISSKFVIDAHGERTNQAVPISGDDRSVGAGNYVVKVGFGTPSRKFNLILDTGSDETWIKCKPCYSGCDEQQKTIYDPKASITSFKPYCISNCSRRIDYLDGTNAQGNWTSDTLTISPSFLLPKFLFICSYNSSKKGFGEAAGLLALGEGDNSLVSQATKAFCYCLPPEHSTGYIVFGSQALQSCQFSSFTQLVSNPPDFPSQYFANLVGISIGNKTLNIFYTKSSSQAAMIDSGTVITRLPMAVYEEFRSAFRKLMENYRLVKSPHGENVLDTCYKLKGYKYSSVKIPAVVLHFENLDVNLDRSQVLWKEGNSSVYCLAFAGNKNDGHVVIIGNHQQQKLNVLFDIQNRKVGIGAGNCGK